METNDNRDKSPVNDKKIQIIKVAKSRGLLFLCVLLIIVLGGALIKTAFFPSKVVETKTSALTPLELIETFEIAALEYRYRNIVFEEITEERSFAFIPLSPAVKRYAVQYDGAIQIGINAEEIVVAVEESLEKQILRITVPNAYIMSHEAPLNDTLAVIFDEADHTENFSIGEYASTLNERKKEMEAEVGKTGFLEQAQQVAASQLEAFLRAIPDVRDNYTLIITLE